MTVQGERIAPNWIYIVLKIFSQFTIFEQLALALKKNRVALKIFTVVNILFTFRIFNNLRLPWQQSFPENFHCIEYIFYYSGFLCNGACPEKHSSPEIFLCNEYTFYIQDFWVTCACPEKQSCPGIFHCIEIFFIIQDF